MISLGHLTDQFAFRPADWQGAPDLLPYPKRVKRNLSQVLKEKVRVINNLFCFSGFPNHFKFKELQKKLLLRVSMKNIEF